MKREDIDINFREIEVRALRNLVSAIKETMDSLQDAQTQQMQDIKGVKDSNINTEGKVVTIETGIQGVRLEVEKLTETCRKIKSFLENNPDIDDKNILQNIQAVEKTIKDLESKCEKKHVEIERKITSMERGTKRKFVEIEEKMETKKPTVQEEMESLCKDLLRRYKFFRTIPFSPVDEKEVSVPLEFFYTEVVIKCEDRENAHVSRFSTRESVFQKGMQQKRNLTSYEQIFKSGKRTVLTGLSGSGKSTFCWKTVNTCRKLQENKIGISTDHEKSSANLLSNVAGSSTSDTSHTKGPATHDTSNVTESSTYDLSNVTGQSTCASTSDIADESILRKFDLLFYINSPAISDETELTEVLCNQCIKREGEGEKTEMQKKLFKLLNDQPEKVLIIFDGLDEIGHTPKFLVDVFNRRLYPGIAVLMAMRPWKISRLGLKQLSHYDLLLEIQGFSFDNALKFVEKVIDMNNNKYGETRDKCLSGKDVGIFTSFKSIPLLLLFLAHIWYRDQSLPDKYKDLYKKIIDFVIERWVKKAGSKCTDTMSDEDDIDLSVKDYWELYMTSACKVAYHFLLERKDGQSVVMPQKELVRKLGENSEVKIKFLLDCGIMSKADLLYPLEKTVSVMFLHMSIQEYLASIYLVQNEDAFQKFLKSLGGINDVLKYENIFIFISGHDTSRGHEAFNRICEVCDKDDLVIQYRDNLDNQDLIVHMNNMYDKCAREMNEQELVAIADVNDLELDNPHLLLSRLKSCSVKSLNLVKGDRNLDLSTLTNLTFLRLKHVTMLEERKSLCSSIGGCSRLENLCLEVIDLNNGVLDLSSLTNMNSLVLTKVTMSEECTKSLCISIDNCIHLKEIILRNISLHECILNLKSQTELKYLELNKVTVSEECSRSLCISMNSCTNLERIVLVKISLHDGVLDLKSLTELKSIRLYDVTMSAECSRSLCRIINKCMDNCTHLLLKNISLYDGVLDLKSLIELCSLQLDNVRMSEECSRSLCSSMDRCTCLVHIYLKNISLYDGVLDLKSLTELTSLQLDNVTMSEECSRSLCSSVNRCTCLFHISLKNISLYDGVLELKSLTKLRVLQLNSVTMSEECSRSLCSTMDRCTCLVHICLENMSLYDGVLKLKSLTKLHTLQLDSVTMSEECSISLYSSIDRCPPLVHTSLSE